MSSQNGKDSVDAWTGMPMDFEDIELDGLLAAPASGVAAFNAVPVPLAPKVPAKRKSPWALADVVWKMIAGGSEGTSTSILGALATDDSARIRRRVAENPGCPPEALALLSEDADPTVRAAVARNRNTPVFLLRQLSNDEDVNVRFAIASNSEMPDAILLSLFLDPDPYVADRASQTLAA
jgi:hypothetical protein